MSNRAMSPIKDCTANRNINYDVLAYILLRGKYVFDHASECWIKLMLLFIIQFSVGLWYNPIFYFDSSW